jgi:proteasome assembly chaperone (PAC2) family protein
VLIDEMPELDAPNVIAAFQGWNDAGQAATTAVRYMVDAWGAQKFASIDPEDYFSFTDTRPMVRIVEGSQRTLTWPSNELYYAHGGEGGDAVLLVGTEPNLRWRSFCGEIIGLAESLHARRIVTLGALITESVHTRPAPLTGFATDNAVQAKLAARQISRSTYEGPTGIVGTLHSLCRDRDIPTASVWAATPYYLGSTPNPKTALGLLEALDDALALKLNLRELREVADDFERQVSLAVRDNGDVQERIKALEEAYDAAERPAGFAQPAAELPETGAIIADLEDFLRQSQRREDE